MNRKLIICILALMAIMPLPVLAGKGKVLKIDFNNPVTERGETGFDLMSALNGTSGKVSLLSYVRAIDAAARDKSIAMIYMTPDNIDAGLSQIEELRAAIERFRRSGKPVVSYCSNLGNASYYLASASDRIVLDPASESMILGLATQNFYLKDILDTLKIDVQLIRHGKYKSAGEMFVRNGSSPENRLQNQELVNSLWDSMVSEIASSRGFSKDEFAAWIDNLELLHSSDFKEKGLVDELWYKDQMDSCICSMRGVNDIRLVSFVKMNKYAGKVRKGRKSSRIAIVYADGEIVTDGSDADIVGSRLASTLEKVAQDAKVKAVIFRVNSPGGSAQAAEAIRRAVTRLKSSKPVIVSFGEYAASGGYWISAGGDIIFTDNTTLTGSIGVFSLIPSFGNALRDNVHVNMEVIGSSGHSDMISGLRKLDDTEVAYMQRQVEKVYDDFTMIVSNGRNLSRERVDELGQGRVWSGADALKNGLADRKGGLYDAVAYARQLCGLEDGRFRIYEYPEIKEESLLQILFGGETIDPEETATSQTSVREPLLPFVGRVQKMTEPSVMLRMESIIELK